MNFLLDHDVPVDAIRILQREGHQAKRTIEFLSERDSDSDILDFAADNGLTLITCNRNHFLVLAGKRNHNGLIILIRRRSRQTELAHLLALLRKAGETGILGNINFA